MLFSTVPSKTSPLPPLLSPSRPPSSTPHLPDLHGSHMVWLPGQAFYGKSVGEIKPWDFKCYPCPGGPLTLSKVLLSQWRASCSHPLAPDWIRIMPITGVGWGKRYSRKWAVVKREMGGSRNMNSLPWRCLVPSRGPICGLPLRAVTALLLSMLKRGGREEGWVGGWGVGGLVLGCDRVPFTLSSACKFSAALAIQPITPKEL